MILKNSNRFHLGRFECKCCDSNFGTSKGVKNLRRRVKRAENQRFRRDVSVGAY